MSVITLHDAQMFRLKHDIHPGITNEAIREVMQLQADGKLPNICPACSRKHGEQSCMGHGCECTCDEATAHRTKTVL